MDWILPQVFKRALERSLVWFRHTIQTCQQPYILGLLGLFVLIGVVAGPQLADAGFITKFVDATIGQLLANIASLIVWVIGQLVILVTDVLIWVAQYNDFLNLEAVRVGWSLVRDLANMFFIVVLLMIAIGTILDIEEYHYSSLLPKIILAAVLINFSKTITGFLIDIGQVIMLTFVNAFRDVMGGNILRAVGLENFLKFRNPVDVLGGSEESPSYFAVIGSVFLAAIMLLITLVVLVVMLVVLVFRIVMLWLLIILSPLPYILAVLPVAEEYASKWWDMLGKYIISGPLLAFFLWLTFQVTSGVGGVTGAFPPNPNQEGAFQGGGRAGEVSQFASEAGTSAGFLTFVVGIALLIGGLKLTEDLGVIGGKLAGQAVEGIQKVGLAPITKPLGLLAKHGPGFLARKMVETGREHPKLAWMKWLTPWPYEGLLKRGEKLEEHAKQYAEASGYQVAENIFRGKKAAKPVLELAEQSMVQELIAERTKEAGPVKSLPKMVEFILRAMQQKPDTEGVMERISMLQYIVGEGNGDDLGEKLLHGGNINNLGTPEDNKFHWKNWGFDSWGQALQLGNDFYRRLELAFLWSEDGVPIGKDRMKEVLKYDPDYHLNNLLGQQYGRNLTELIQERSDQALRRELASQGIDFDTLTPDVKEAHRGQRYDGDKAIILEDLERGELMVNGRQVDKAVLDQSEHLALEAAHHAKGFDHDRLRSMYASSMAAQEVGHWEQITGGLDPETGHYFVRSGRQVSGWILGEGKKRGTRDIGKTLAPHNVMATTFEPDSEGRHFVADPASPTGARFVGHESVRSERTEAMGYVQRRTTAGLMGAADMDEGSRQFQSRMAVQLTAPFFEDTNREAPVYRMYYSDNKGFKRMLSPIKNDLGEIQYYLDALGKKIDLATPGDTNHLIIDGIQRTRDELSSYSRSQWQKQMQMNAPLRRAAFAVANGERFTAVKPGMVPDYPGATPAAGGGGTPGGGGGGPSMPGFESGRYT